MEPEQSTRCMSAFLSSALLYTLNCTYVPQEFLFYHQKELEPDEAADLPPTRYARVTR